MLITRPNIAAFICFVVILTTCFIRPSLALDINTLRFGVHPDKIRLVLEVSDVTDFRAFTQTSPPRLILDLPSFNWKAGNIKKDSQTFVTDIRQGALQPGISRIVLDLGKDPIIDAAFLLPKQGTSSNRIVIDYREGSAAEIQSQKGKIFGTLEIDDTAHKATPNTAEASGIPIPPANDERPIAKAPVVKPLVIIDPGHGGQDPGARNPTYKINEKDVVLALSKQLKAQLESTGRYRVLLTRETDKYIRLKNRVKFARDHGGDLFVSIHADSIHKSSVRGTSVYTISKKSSDAQTAKLAEKENQADIMAGLDLQVEDQQVAFILGDFLMTDTMNQSKFFANTLVEKLSKHGIKTLQNPHRFAGFAVLKAPDIPSVLVEAGFMSNNSEARLLNQTAHRAKLAKAIQYGIDAYFEHLNAGLER